MLMVLQKMESKARGPLSASSLRVLGGRERRRQRRDSVPARRRVLQRLHSNHYYKMAGYMERNTVR